jgi:periplasmic protein TonB
MSYTDQKEMSAGRMASIGLVALLHVGAGYALVTGLAYDAAKQAIEDLKTFDVQEDKPEEPDKPPPPPEKLDIPPPPKVTAPPPVVQSPVVSTNTQMAAPPPMTIAAPPAPPPPPPPPPAPKVAQKATQKGGSISDEDYPSSSIRNEEQGVSRASFTIGTDGKVASCNASGASPTLDALTCSLIQRRFRFKPALDESGNPISETRTQNVRWKLPQ